MEQKEQTPMVCKSVFKSGETTSKSQFTQIWVELINRLEKNKAVIIVPHP